MRCIASSRWALVYSQSRPPHLEILDRLVMTGRVTGPRVQDARVAAICIGQGVSELWTADRDYSRFPELKTRNPLVVLPV